MLLLGTAALASADRTVPTRAEIDASVQAAVAAAGGKIPTPQEIDTILKAALAAGLKSIPTPQEIDAFIKASTGRRSMREYRSSCFSHLCKWHELVPVRKHLIYC